MSLMTRLTSDAILKKAFTWLCRQQRDWPTHADVWDLRRHWPWEKARLRNTLCEGTYQFGLLSRKRLAQISYLLLLPYIVLGDGIRYSPDSPFHENAG